MAFICLLQTFSLPFTQYTQTQKYKHRHRILFKNTQTSNYDGLSPSWLTNWTKLNKRTTKFLIQRWCTKIRKLFSKKFTLVRHWPHNKNFSQIAVPFCYCKNKTQNPKVYKLVGCLSWMERDHFGCFELSNAIHELTVFSCCLLSYYIRLLACLLLNAHTKILITRARNKCKWCRLTLASYYTHW